MLHNLLIRLRALFHRDEVEADFDEELRYHLDREIERNLARGMSPEEARCAARRGFGDPYTVKEEARTTWRWRRVDELAQDLRYAARAFRRSPGFTVVTVLSLGFGIGASMTVFSVIDVLDFRPLPYRDADRLVWLTEVAPVTDRYCPGCAVTASRAIARDWQQQARSYEAFAFETQSARRFVLRNGESIERPVAAEISPGFAGFLGVRPLFGREFTPDDTLAGAEAVVLLSYDFWRRRFGSDPGVVGTRLEYLDGPTLTDTKGLTIVGVLPQDFRFAGIASFWIPASHEAATSRLRRGTTVAARLRPGVTRAAADAELRAIGGRLVAAYPDEYEGWGFAIRSLRERLGWGAGEGRRVLFGVTTLVLLIAVMNVAGLVLARSASRQSEFTVRSALGAARFRLARQLVVEGVTLGLAGGALGTLLTVWGVRAAAYWFGFTPSGISPEIDHRIVGFGMSLSVVAGVLSTLLPAVRTTRTDQYAALRDRSGGTFRTRTSRAPGALLTTQIASGLILLTGAGLLTSDFLKRRYLDLGFDPRNMYEVSLLGPSGVQRDAWRNTLLELRARAARVPGVAGTALEHRSAVAPAIVRPQDASNLIAPERHTPAVAAVDPTYFETFGMSLIEGRAFTDADTRGNRLVAVVNATVAANFWPGASPLGRQLFVGDSIGTGEWLTVIGVADDVERGEFVDRHFPMVYRPFEQAPLYHSGGRLYVRVAASEGVLPVVQRAVREVLGYPASPFESVEKGLAQRLLQARFNALALNAFAAFALLLAAMGIYGSVAYAVSRRTREIGIRVALGAERGNVLVLVARNAVLTAVAGVVLGLTGSVMLTHLFRALVSATSVTSPWIFGASASLIVAVSVLAAYLPARRATRVHPVIALRSE